MIKNLPANMGDMSSVSGLGRSYVLGNNKVLRAQLLYSRAHALQQEKSPQRAHALQQEKSPQREACTPQLEKAPVQQQRPNIAKNEHINKIK